MGQAAEEFAQVEAEAGGWTAAAEICAQAVVTSAACHRIVPVAAVSRIKQAGVVVIDPQFGQIDVNRLLREGLADGFQFVQCFAD